MDVSNATAASLGPAIGGPQQPATVKEQQPEKQPEKQQDSAVVKLSEQAQQQSRMENRDPERTETGPQETAEPQGIQFMEGEKKGGRVDTFA